MKFIKPEGHPPLIYHQEIAWRWIATIVAYFFLSFIYSAISLAFQIPSTIPLPLNRRRQKRQRLREGHIPCILDAELGGHDGAGVGVRERGDGDRPTVDGVVVDILGDHEREHELL